MARSVPPGSVTELVAHVRDVYASRITGEATLPAGLAAIVSFRLTWTPACAWRCNSAA